MTSLDTLTPDQTERDADEAAFMAWADEQAEREFAREQAYRLPREEVREYDYA